MEVGIILEEYIIINTNFEKKFYASFEPKTTTPKYILMKFVKNIFEN